MWVSVCVCVCVCVKERWSERESTQAGQRGFPSLYGTRVSGIKPSLSLGFDRHYTYISMGTDTDRETGSTHPTDRHTRAINTQIHVYTHADINPSSSFYMRPACCCLRMCSILCTGRRRGFKKRRHHKNSNNVVLLLYSAPAVTLNVLLLSDGLWFVLNETSTSFHCRYTVLWFLLKLWCFCSNSLFNEWHVMKLCRTLTSVNS